MAGYDVDYFDRMLPYTIPGEIPTYDPALFKTSRMRNYHESYPQQDSGMSEIADMKQRAGRLADITTGYDPPPTDNRLMRLIDELASKYKDISLSDLPAAWEHFWHPEAFDESGSFTGNIHIDPIAIAMGLGGGIGKGPVSYTHLTLPTNREV